MNITLIDNLLLFFGLIFLFLCHSYKLLRSVFVFFAVFMFSMNSPVLALFNTSALGEETLSLSLPVKFFKIVVESSKQVNRVTFRGYIC